MQQHALQDACLSPSGPALSFVQANCLLPGLLHLPDKLQHLLRMRRQRAALPNPSLLSSRTTETLKDEMEDNGNPTRSASRQQDAAGPPIQLQLDTLLAAEECASSSTLSLTTSAGRSLQRRKARLSPSTRAVLPPRSTARAGASCSR